MASNRRTLLRDFLLPNPVYANVEVSVFLTDATGDLTSTLADLFEDQTSALALLNPQTLDSQGKFGQPVYFQDDVICVIDGLGVGQQQTGVISPQVEASDIDNATQLSRIAMSERLTQRPMLTRTPI